ncbi:SDR family oxidoreductase [Rhodococcus sp. 15-725-2-2b]|uniref:SDR family oxidoreductase n=1 Tax=Rhodococcus sp. 15-725-2-2b TaxID=2023139 RepID=UPI00211B01C1|nr:SDR family oxidoreductase [Rhodococcus sp. 15-725-2-2b]
MVTTPIPEVLTYLSLTRRPQRPWSLQLAQLHPLGRMGEIAEVVQAVLFLEKAAFVTGETVHVDGGQHAGRW